MASSSPDVFALLASHRDRNSFDSGSKDGFKRYSAHLTRKIASLRKTLGISGKGKIDDAKIGEDSKSLEFLLLSVERAYISALSPASTSSHTSKSNKQHALSRLSKALSHAAPLLSHPSVAGSPLAKAQTTVFTLLLQATRALKKDDIESALEAFVLGLVILRALEPKLDAVKSARVGEWVERDFEPSLRFCAYKLRGGREEDVDQILVELEEDLPEIEKSFGVDSSVLENVKAMPDASVESKGGGSLVWLGQEQQVKNARLVGALAKVESGRKILEDKFEVGRGGTRKKGVLKTFDKVLNAARDGLEVISSGTMIGPNGDSSSSSSKVFLTSYLSYVQSTTLIQRDLHLLYFLLRSPSGELDPKTLVKVVRLLGAVVTQWETVGLLSEVERGANGEGEAVEIKVGWFRSLRLFYLAKLYLTPGFEQGPEKALALIPRCTLLLRQLERSIDDAPEEWPLGGSDPAPVTHETVIELEKSVGREEVKAKDALWTQRPREDGEEDVKFLDLAVNFVDLEKFQQPAAPIPAAAVKAAVKSAVSTVDQGVRSAVAPVSGEPEEDEEDEEAEEEPEEESSSEDENPKKKGWLGGWFSRG